VIQFLGIVDIILELEITKDTFKGIGLKIGIIGYQLQLCT